MAVENNKPATGGATGKGFLPGQSGNPGGRPKGLARYVREIAPAEELADWQRAIWLKDEAELAKLGISLDQVTLEERQKAHQWLTERGHGKAPSFAPVVEADPLDRDQTDAAIDALLDELADKREAKASGPAADDKLAGTG